VVVLALLGFHGSAARTMADVNLELRLPSPATPEPGDVLRVGLFAVSDNAADQPFAGIDAILQWDAAVLSLEGKVDDGPFDWSSSSFPNDRFLDGLNADCTPSSFCSPYTGLPYNDGVVLYQAFVISLNPEPPMATPEGLLVTTFQFRAVGPACDTGVSLPAEMGDSSHSRVVMTDPEIGQFEVTGALIGSSLELPACGSGGDFNGDCQMTLIDYGDFRSCLGGPDHLLGLPCRPADADADGDADLRDFAAAQRWFECP
jgi:hypothetical protein